MVAALFVAILGARQAAPLLPPATTPVEAARRVVYAAPGRAITVMRVNRAGRFASVRFRGALMEATPAAPILVERFPFGWQAIESLNFRCRLVSHAGAAAVAARLMAGMPPLADDRMACGPNADDAGPATDVLALRRLQGASLVPTVVVSGRFGLAEWYGGGGGEHVYRKDGARWSFVSGGGGALSASDLAKLGVPRKSICAFHAFGVACPARSPEGR